MTCLASRIVLYARKWQLRGDLLQWLQPCTVGFSTLLCFSSTFYCHIWADSTQLRRHLPPNDFGTAWRVTEGQCVHMLGSHAWQLAGLQVQQLNEGYVLVDAHINVACIRLWWRLFLWLLQSAVPWPSGARPHKHLNSCQWLTMVSWPSWGPLMGCAVLLSVKSEATCMFHLPFLQGVAKLQSACSC